jgi:glycine dehydrogenase subunit 2
MSTIPTDPEPLTIEYDYPDIEPSMEDAADFLPESLLRKKAPGIPDLAEWEIIRHFTHLSLRNYGVDNGFYPLGSCTMKYNPRVNEAYANRPEITNMHPLQHEDTIQGSLRIMYELQNMLAVVGGVDAVTLQPAAGAHGEFTGLLIARAFHEKNGEDRPDIILPDTAHGTNPASAHMAGFNVIELESGEDGCVNLEALEAALSEKTACFMLTNPNTLGIFEHEVLEIARLVHKVGALLYYDGANLNAIMGKTTPGIMGFDIVHFNLHKTFSTPHGGGGPGSGPIGVTERLKEFLPVPQVGFDGEKYFLDNNMPDSIGKIIQYYGNFGILVRAYVYILANGGKGLERVSERAVLNAAYIMNKLLPNYKMPFKQQRKHEFVLSGENDHGFRTLDIAKRLLDYGFHAPTVYFPHLVPEAIMIEPTETESKKNMDSFILAMNTIMTEEADILKAAPCGETPVCRVDELYAVKNLTLNWNEIHEE